MGEVQRLGVDARTAEGSKEGTRTVIDEDPGQGGAGRQQRHIEGEARLPCRSKLLGGPAQSTRRDGHDEPSVAECRRNGWASWVMTIRGTPDAGADCSRGTGRPSIPVRHGTASRTGRTA